MNLNDVILDSKNLKLRRWSKHNKKRLLTLINEKAFQNNYAVFDWDFTCIFYDTQDSLFIYQLENLIFKLTPKEFSKTIREGIPQDIPFQKKFAVEGQILTPRLLSKDLDERYSFIYKNYNGFDGNLSLEEIKATEEYKDFKAKFIALAFGAENLCGRDICQSVSTGFTLAELSEVAEHSIDTALGDDICEYTIQSSKNLKGASGIVKVFYRKGIRVRPEIQELFLELKSKEIEIYVCSASQVEGIKVFATNTKYEYIIKPECIFGRKRILKDGKITDQYDLDIPATYKEGKAQTIEQIISPRHQGKAPILIAGDSDGDFYMMDKYKDESLLLILQRETSPNDKINYFINRGIAQEGDDDAKIIVQQFIEEEE